MGKPKLLAGFLFQGFSSFGLAHFDPFSSLELKLVDLGGSAGDVHQDFIPIFLLLFDLLA